MSRKIINALKSKVKELKYKDLKAPTEPENEDNISSGHLTYVDLKREQNLTINGQVITNDFINTLCSDNGGMILEDENGQNNYRPFLNRVFIEMFEHVGAATPNNSIIEELITNYNQAGYSSCLCYQQQSALNPFDLFILGNEREQTIGMDCDKPDCLKFSFSQRTKCVFDNGLIIKCNLSCSAEFKLKCKDGNVTYEDGKVSLIIPKELKNYKANGKNLFDTIIEYFQKFCEKFGFHFETKIEHSLNKPLRVLSDVNVLQDKNLNLNNLK